MFIDNTVPLGHSFNQDSYDEGVNTLVDLADNTSGLIIRTALFANASTTEGDMEVTLFADTSEPSSESDLTKRIVFSCTIPPEGVILLPYPLTIATGWGLWLGVAGVEPCNFLMTYDAVAL